MKNFILNLAIAFALVCTLAGYSQKFDSVSASSAAASRFVADPLHVFEPQIGVRHGGVKPGTSLGVVTLDNTTTSTSSSFSHTIGTGINPGIAILISVDDNAANPSISYNGVTVTRRTCAVDDNTVKRTCIYVDKTAATAGSYTVSVFGGAWSNYFIAVVTLFGVHQTTPHGGSSFASGLSSTPTTSPSGFDANDMIFGGIVESSSSTLAVGASQTIIGSVTNSSLFARRATSGAISSSGGSATSWGAVAGTVNHD